MSIVSATLQQFVHEHPFIKRWWVAYSGGLDSAVLLHGLVAANPAVPVRALHVHHGLSAFADQWQAHCEAQCAALGVELTVEKVTVTAAGRGVEDAARRARYQAFERHLLPGDGLLLAHHQDDQAETLLLRLLRGSGPRGLAGMAAQRPVGAGTLFRPLLEVPRAQLERQAQQWALSWVDDDSNQSVVFDRNYLRLQVLPAVQQRWPDFARQWQHSASLCSEAEQLQQDIAAEDWQRAGWRPERLGSSVDLAYLQGVSAFRRGNVIRYWVEHGLEHGSEEQQCELPERVHLQEIEEQLIAGRQDSMAVVSWGSVQLRRFRQRLYLLSVGVVRGVRGQDRSHTDRSDRENGVQWDGRQPLIWGGWRLSLEPVETGGFRRPAQGFTVRSREGGERCHPVDRPHSQTLKKLLQEADVEPWLRSQLPVLTVDGHIAVVADLWFCRGWEAAPGQGYRLCWRAADQATDEAPDNSADKAPDDATA